MRSASRLDRRQQLGRALRARPAPPAGVARRGAAQPPSASRLSTAAPCGSDFMMRGAGRRGSDEAVQAQAIQGGGTRRGARQVQQRLLQLLGTGLGNALPDHHDQRHGHRGAWSRRCADWRRRAGSRSAAACSWSSSTATGSPLAARRRAESTWPVAVMVVVAGSGPDVMQHIAHKGLRIAGRADEGEARQCRRQRRVAALQHQGPALLRTRGWHIGLGQRHHMQLRAMLDEEWVGHEGQSCIGGREPRQVACFVGVIHRRQASRRANPPPPPGSWRILLQAVARRRWYPDSPGRRTPAMRPQPRSVKPYQ